MSELYDPSPDIVVYGLEVNRQQNCFVAACEDGYRGELCRFPN